MSFILESEESHRAAGRKLADEVREAYRCETEEIGYHGEHAVLGYSCTDDSGGMHVHLRLNGFHTSATISECDLSELMKLMMFLRAATIQVHNLFHALNVEEAGK